MRIIDVWESRDVLGDRERDLALLAGEYFDWVLDTSGYVPRVVRSAVEALAAERWCFISSISAYADACGAAAGFVSPRWNSVTAWPRLNCAKRPARFCEPSSLLLNCHLDLLTLSSATRDLRHTLCGSAPRGRLE
jgi:hypothetical protein